MLDRTVAPAFRQIEHISIKQAEKFKLSNNIPLYTITAGTQPVIKLELAFDSGKWTEKKPGTAFFTSKMLREGVKGFNSFEISRFFESLGAHLEITPTLDIIFVTIYTLEKHLQNLLPIIKLLITEPTFPETELDSFKNIQIQSLRVNNEKNSFVANKKLRESLYGTNHPYGHILDEEDIKSLTSQDLAVHFKNTFLNRPFTIIMSGSFGPNSIESIENSFHNLSVINGNEVISSIDQLPDHPDVSIDRKESSQTSIRLGKLSLSMDHKDYLQLLVVNEILGGYFGSRLMKNIREEKGLTYGIYSSITSLLRSTYFSISADVKKENRSEAFDEIAFEINRLRTEPVPNDELTTVKNYMLGHIQATINTPFALAMKFKNIYFNGLGYEYYENLIESIKSITPEEVQTIASKYLDVDDMARVYVG